MNEEWTLEEIEISNATDSIDESLLSTLFTTEIAS
jgi:hypothetical protein